MFDNIHFYTILQWMDFLGSFWKTNWCVLFKNYNVIFVSCFQIAQTVWQFDSFVDICLKQKYVSGANSVGAITNNINSDISNKDNNIKKFNRQYFNGYSIFKFTYHWLIFIVDWYANVVYMIFNILCCFLFYFYCCFVINRRHWWSKLRSNTSVLDNFWTFLKYFVI